MRYLRHREDGFLYEWHPILAAHPKLEEITEEQAFPERFIPAAVRERKPAVNLATATIPDPGPQVSAELTREASTRPWKRRS
jgi:hypothetical protein